MSLRAKLQLKGPIRVKARPAGVDIGDVEVSDAAPGVLRFVTMAADLDAATDVFDAAGCDDAAWIAYPKAKQLGTDLNRDILAAKLPATVRPVRQISIDAVWSALRLRPS